MGIPFVALNVQNTKNDYTTFLNRPITDSTKRGLWNDGKNCGRFVNITIQEYCEGAGNSGDPGTTWCNGGVWKNDTTHSGAWLVAIVGDSCQDGNRWCRDDTNHLDIFSPGLAKFKRFGQTVDMNTKWNNRRIKWSFIRSPFALNIKLYFS